MNIQNIKNITRFFELIEKIEGNIYLVNENGKLDLKSKLSQFLVIARINNDDLEEGIIEFSNESDKKFIEEQILDE